MWRMKTYFSCHRAEVRSKKLCSIDVDEKLKLGRELRQMDREQDKLEAELSSYQEKEVSGNVGRFFIDNRLILGTVHTK